MNGDVSDKCYADIPGVLKSGPMAMDTLRKSLNRGEGPVMAALVRLIADGVVRRTMRGTRTYYSLGREEPEQVSSRIAGPCYRRGLVWGNARPRSAA